jgi:hypothetical protein
MARPGLEPGTPRFSDSCTERSNARESPATAQLPAHTARTAKSASCMKLREMLDASYRSCPNRPAAAMPAAARARTPRPTRDSRRRHCSRSARLELRSCSSRASVWSLSTEMPACPPERERWSCRGIVPLGPIWRSGLRCWFAWIRRSASLLRYHGFQKREGSDRASGGRRSSGASVSGTDSRRSLCVEADL